ELDDAVEAVDEVATGKAEERAVEEDVLAAGHLGGETGPELEKRCDAAGDLDPPLGRSEDPRYRFEKRRLSGAVAADDAEDLTLSNGERDVADGPELFGFDGPALDEADGVLAQG